MSKGIDVYKNSSEEKFPSFSYVFSSNRSLSTDLTSVDEWSTYTPPNKKRISTNLLARYLETYF